MMANEYESGRARPLSAAEQREMEVRHEEKEVSGEREKPESPKQQVQRFLFESQQYGDEAKMLAKELPTFMGNKLMTEAGLQQYRERLTKLVGYLQNCVGYAEKLIQAGAPYGSMDQLEDGVVRDRSIIERAESALAESERIEEAQRPRSRVNLSERRTQREAEAELAKNATPDQSAALWAKKEEPALQPKKSFWSKLNPKNWFGKK